MIICPAMVLMECAGTQAGWMWRKANRSCRSCGAERTCLRRGDFPIPMDIGIGLLRIVYEPLGTM